MILLPLLLALCVALGVYRKLSLAAPPSPARRLRVEQLTASGADLEQFGAAHEAAFGACTDKVPPRDPVFLHRYTPAVSDPDFYCRRVLPSDTAELGRVAQDLVERKLKDEFFITGRDATPPLFWRWDLQGIKNGREAHFVIYASGGWLQFAFEWGFQQAAQRRR